MGEMVGEEYREGRMAGVERNPYTYKTVSWKIIIIKCFQKQ